MEVAAIDLSPWFHGTQAERAAVAAEVRAVCEGIGFLKITNHGVSEAVVVAAFDAADRFFDRPPEQKAQFRPADGSAPRGWHALETKNLAKTLGLDAPPDLREQFYIGPLRPDRARIAGIPEAESFYMDNIWPDAPDDYRPAVTRCYEAMENLARELMRIFATALGMEETAFDGAIDNHFATLPINFYPVPAHPPKPGQLRAGAHSDFGSLTILAMHGAKSGLQVKLPDGNWLDVEAAPGEFVINLGDMMQRWTNDHWRSTIHRVANPDNPGNSRRLSLGFFLHPNYDTVLEALPGCTGPGDPPRYPPIQAGELMRQKMMARATG